MTDLILNPDGAEIITPDSVQIVKDVHNCLQKHYPGYTWIVGVNDDKSGGVVNILNMDVNSQIFGNPNLGYVLHLKTIYGDPELKCVMRAGGEILERAYFTALHKQEQLSKVDGVDHNRHPIIQGNF